MHAAGMRACMRESRGRGIAPAGATADPPARMREHRAARNEARAFRLHLSRSPQCGWTLRSPSLHSPRHRTHL